MRVFGLQLNLLLVVFVIFCFLLSFLKEPEVCKIFLKLLKQETSFFKILEKNNKNEKIWCKFQFSFLYTAFNFLIRKRINWAISPRNDQLSYFPPSKNGKTVQNTSATQVDGWCVRSTQSIDRLKFILCEYRANFKKENNRNLLSIFFCKVLFGWPLPRRGVRVTMVGALALYLNCIIVLRSTLMLCARAFFPLE